MFKYFVLLLISLTCLSSEPKFHFMDCVKIINGFYKGCKGDVTGFKAGASPDGGSTYNVDVYDCKGKGFFDNFDEKQLEACKK